MLMDRRGFLGVLAGAIAAPAIVRASSIMPVRAPTLLSAGGPWVPDPIGPFDDSLLIKFDAALQEYWDKYRLSPTLVAIVVPTEESRSAGLFWG